MNELCVIYILSLPPGIAGVTNFCLQSWEFAMLTQSTCEAPLATGFAVCYCSLRLRTPRVFSLGHTVALLSTCSTTVSPGL